MKSQHTFSQALQFLDIGAQDEGEDTLRQAVALAEREQNTLVLGGALCCLGELLMAQNRPQEALPLLRRLVRMNRTQALVFEVDRAQELLAAHSA